MFGVRKGKSVQGKRTIDTAPHGYGTMAAISLATLISATRAGQREHAIWREARL